MNSHGLSKAQAAERLSVDGFNELPSTKPRSTLTIALNLLREPMLLLLAACATIYSILGSLGEAAVLFVLVFVVIGIELYQHRKTERALDALRDLSSPRALVIRDSERIRIAGREVVIDDLLVLVEGDRVPADVTLLEVTNLRVDESLLTGESVPVDKAQDEIAYSGTLVVNGDGLARVKATAMQTELGRIGKSLQTLTDEPTLVQQDTRGVVRIMSIAAISLCVLTAILYGLLRGQWLQGSLAALSMAMSVLPEELPVVLTIFLALGAWRMSRVRVLTRNMPAIEMLGAATVLCVDKTGTLTWNRMDVQRLSANGETLDTSAASQLPESFHDLMEHAILASQLEAHDPMDRAFHDLGQRTLSGTEHLHQNWTLVRQYPLAPHLLALSHVWQSPDAADYVIGAKGAPEAILDLCHLPPADNSMLLAEAAKLASGGLRVLGVAKCNFNAHDLPASQHDFPFRFLGFAALADPLRPSVPAAIEECREAGIRVVMITGDHASTAKSIARQAGLPDGSGVMTGSELAQLAPEALQARLPNISVFARVVPQQKLLLVEALKARGEIVAMTGDGVNDAPALKAAHIGIAMGERGTDVAREASDVVLLDDDFASIVKGVRMGRRVFENLRKAVGYIISIHVPLAGLTFLPVVFGWPSILGPVHIAFLELIIDPACSIVFEAEEEESDLMHRPPRAASDRLFESRLVRTSLLSGMGALLILLAIFSVAFYRGQGEADARALTFTSFVLINLALILTNRSRSRNLWETVRTPNAAMWWIICGALVFLAVTWYVPSVTALFRFSTLHRHDVVLCLAAGLAALAWFEAVKRFARH